MWLNTEDRVSDSTLVERVWRSHSETAGMLLSVAASSFEMVVTRHRGKTVLTARGPETRATRADYPEDAEWLGVRFKVGTFIPALLPRNLLDRRDVTLPGAATNAFWLNGSAWEYPSFENADVFVSRLVRKGVIARDSVVDAVAHRGTRMQSLRSTQRHFLRATGITCSTWRQIERARHATQLLREGVSILDTVELAGYFDQPHLTRSLMRRMGQTPTQIIQRHQQLSFLYKTEAPSEAHDGVGEPTTSRRIRAHGQNHRH
jgi:AraC-like DNA-binding protein